MDVTLTYAVPVHVLDLGASLKAYIDTLPVTNQLRLCNRFGQGNQAFITKLPVELLGLVEYYVKRPVRKGFRAGWKKDLKCFEQKCSFLDHLSWEQKLEIYQVWADQMGVYSEPPREEPTEKDVNAVVEEMMDEDKVDDDFSVHWARRSDWEQRMLHSKNGKGRGFFGENRDLVVQHFGIGWLQRMPRPDGDHRCIPHPTQQLDALGALGTVRS